jgi:hypothetical protein
MATGAAENGDSAALTVQSADDPMVGPAMAFQDYPDGDRVDLRAGVPAGADSKEYEDPPVDAAVDPERSVTESAAHSVVGRTEA